VTFSTAVRKPPNTQLSHRPHDMNRAEGVDDESGSHAGRLIKNRIEGLR
jgi:hypothetical protein